MDDLPDKLQRIRELSTVQSRVNAICAAYAAGDPMLEGASVEDIAGLLNVDLEFGGDWGYSAVPWSEPDEESLNQLEACSIVGFLSDQVGSNRLEALTT